MTKNEKQQRPRITSETQSRRVSNSKNILSDKKLPKKELTAEQLRRIIPSIENSSRRRKFAVKLREVARKEKSKLRRARKVAEERGEIIERQKPKTQETLRAKDETIVPPDDEEICDADQVDEFASYFSGEIKPKILLTTSKHASNKLRQFIKELMIIIPNVFYYKRGNLKIKSMVKFATKMKFTDVVILCERLKRPCGMYICHLPEGPTSFFKISNLKLAQDMKGSAACTTHDPEVMLNNFTTRLGQRIARQLAALFPQKPEFEGRRVICFHNQRDFIFFRHHSKDDSGCRLQEIGPRFTLKLHRLQQGTFDPLKGLLEYNWTADSQVDRKLVFI